MGELKNNSCCMNNCNHESKFVIMVDETEECKKQAKCNGPIQGIPVQQVFIDLSDCKHKECKKDACSKTNTSS